MRWLALMMMLSCSSPRAQCESMGGTCYIAGCPDGGASGETCEGWPPTPAGLTCCPK